MKRIIGVIFYFLACVTAQAGVPCALPFTLTQGTVANATEVMANYNAIITCLTNAAAAGSNNDITALNGLLTAITPAQGGTNVFIGGTSGGTANAQTLATTTPNTFTLTQGYTVVFRVGVTNTGPMTMTIGSLGAVNVFRTAPSGAQAMTGGEMNAGNIAAIQYDGTQFQLLTSSNQLGGYGPTTDLASAIGVLDLGTVASHNVKVTDLGTTITSFGASAVLDYPVYIVKFDNSVTLVNNVVSLQLPSSANIVTATGDTLVARYLGTGSWRVLSYSRFNGTSVVSPTSMCGAQGLVFTSNGTNANITYAADQAVMINPTGNVPIYATGITGTINTSIGVGAGVPAVDGMDGEATPISNFGFIYLISNGTTTSGLVSSNSVAPLFMPAGYTYRCRLGAFKFSAAAIPLTQRSTGSDTSYFPTAATNVLNFPILVSTGACCAAFTSLNTLGTPISSFVPSTATRVRLIMACTTNCTMALSSNTQTNGSVFSATNPSECERQDTNVTTWICELPYNAGAVFLQAVNAGTWSIAVKGWHDKVMAQ